MVFSLFNTGFPRGSVLAKLYLASNLYSPSYSQPIKPDDDFFMSSFRLVTAIGDAYGVALLLHMLTTTITLTLLAYQATKVNTYCGILGYMDWLMHKFYCKI